MILVLRPLEAALEACAGSTEYCAEPRNCQRRPGFREVLPEAAKLLVGQRAHVAASGTRPCCARFVRSTDVVGDVARRDS